jgi:hypothetical protein
MGLRSYRELLPMKRSQVELKNLVYMPNTKTPIGSGGMPMTELAPDAFKAHIEATAGSEYLLPCMKRNQPNHRSQFKRHPGRQHCAELAFPIFPFTISVTRSPAVSVQAVGYENWKDGVKERLRW